MKVATYHGMKIVTRAPAQRPTRRSARRWSNRNATVDDQTDVITFCALTRRRIVSALWQVFLQKQLEVREGKDKVLATWIRDVIPHDLGRRAPFIDVVAPGCARVLMSALRARRMFWLSQALSSTSCIHPPLVPSQSTLHVHPLSQSCQLALWHNVLAATCWL